VFCGDGVILIFSAKHWSFLTEYNVEQKQTWSLIMLQANLDLAIKLRKELHQHPEPSGEERWTKNHIFSFLKTHTSLEMHDRGQWFYGVYRNPGGKGRSIAFRADFDAIRMEEQLEIPHKSLNNGVAHKCGHDGHSAVLAGFALEVDQFGADADIFFLFQFGEEDGSGAKECAVLLEENEIDVIYGFHNMSGLKQNSILVIDGIAHCASTGMIIELIGSSCHASMPEEGINPAYGLADLVLKLPDLTSKKTFTGKVFCTVIRIDLGEAAFGISPGRGKLLLTLRAEREHELCILKSALEQCVATVAEKHKLEFTTSYVESFPETYNHRESNDAVRELKNLGFDIQEQEEPFRASEDFGHYTKKTKGALFYIGNGRHYPAIHTSGYDFNDGIIETGVEAFKALAK